MDPQLPTPSGHSSASDALSSLGLTATQAGRLGARRREALVSFLLRWEQYQQALDCLDELLPHNPTLVSLLDDRARALQGLGRFEAALAVMSARHQRRVSFSSRILEGRIYLASGHTDAALGIARDLLSEAAQSLPVLDLLAEVHLARGEHDAALATHRRVNELNPDSRAVLLGMLSVYQALGDQVTASGYAVRLERSAAEGWALPIPVLRRLRDYYRSSGEAHRVADLEANLSGLYQKELVQLEAALGGNLADIARRAQQPLSEHRIPASVSAASPSVPQAISVSPEERSRLERAARDLFGYEHLLPGQAETLTASLRGQDVLTILRTGGGKSLCYQLPAFLDKAGVTLVISPLIALMKDQVDSLPPTLRSCATTINSTLDGDELRQCLQNMAAGRFRLIYAAPERLRQTPFLHVLRKAGVSCLVIDEVHCVSMWGHDFRPDYLYISQARRGLGNPKVLAMTATAPPRVRRDILQRLEMSDAVVVASEAERPNLYLGAIRAKKQDEKLRHLLALCQRETGSGIVYVNSRNRAEELARLLCQQGISAGYYHAGIGDRDARAAAQDTFMGGAVRVMVATVAFGMGIDKADIRFIIHYDLPSSLESYYQEAGRAGRDGRAARCTLLYTPNDRGTLTGRARRDQLSVETLRAVYGAVKGRLEGTRVGRVALGDLARDVEAEETAVRVALSLLEETGLLRRHQDIPRNALVRWHPSMLDDAPKSDPIFAAFLDAARLRPGQSLGLDLIQVARACGLDPLGIEERLLAWADAGWLSYRPAGRDLLLEILPAPQDATAEVHGLLDRYTSIQVQRVDEIMAYAQTHRCRHGHISAYLSGQPSARCQSCDNCRPEGIDGSTSAALVLPSESEQLQVILRYIASVSWSWGRVSLIRIFRGDKEAPEQGRDAPEWGQLAFRSEAAIGDLLDRLLAARLLCTRSLGHGGVVLDLTPAGRAASRDTGGLIPSAEVTPVRSSTSTEAPAPIEGSGLPDPALLERLRAWRRETAREAGVPPYVVAHDSLLQRIATAKPRDEAQLGQIKGIGPKKLAQYGAAILGIVAGG